MSAQQNPGPLFETLHRRVVPNFDGATYDAKLDRARLRGQLAAVFNLLATGGWWTLRDLAESVDGSEAGVSARLRDLRKAKFGGYLVERRRVEGGLWEYRLIP